MRLKELYTNETPIGEYEVKSNFKLLVYIPYGLSKGVKLTNFMVAEKENGIITRYRLRRVHYDAFMEKYYFTYKGNKIWLSDVEAKIDGRG